MIMLCFLSATSYVLSTIGMKYWDVLPRVPIAAFIALTLALAVWTEIQALRQAELAITFMLILGLEAVIAIGAGYWLMGEAVSVTRLLGIGLVLTGVALIHAAPSAS